MPSSSTQSSCIFKRSPGLVFQEGYWKYGRYYGNWRNSYHFPIDSEELTRLDMLNKFFYLARGGQAFSSPLRRGGQTRVLDLGTGTGIWAIQVAEDVDPVPHVMAVDLHKIQPALLVGTPSYLQATISNNSWPATYQKAFKHTAPGGHLEQVEIEWVPRWEGATMPECSALLEWSQKFLSGMDEFHRSARLSGPNVRRMVETAGYVDFKETIIRCCVSPWCHGQGETLVANWFNICFTEGIEAMSLVPLMEKCYMTLCQVKALQARVKRESCNLKFHAYFNMHVWVARRPH
ncbi:hypothetical protein NLG97_g248 [Lecanicillium saksenae]|uniref:Uncharacterized protein n=1 Tax=Lecanicillium saksenae TaxID=468837 RepID=A0ACC1RAJ5_9HYPO|nr:hypothetical protein NLG97_g248 [Lecanicillium saksenae]